MDRDGSGYIDKAELEPVCKILGLDPKVLLHEMELGSDHVDNKVTIDEFEAWCVVFFLVLLMDQPWPMTCGRNCALFQMIVSVFDNPGILGMFCPA